MPALLLVGLVGLIASGCRSGGADSACETVTVYAASSLTEAFQELARGFEQAHPRVDVELIFAGSQVLRLQLEQGAQADVFASANAAHMVALASAGMVSEQSIFARNELVVIVPASDNPGIRSFSDLVRARRLVVASENVPVGAYTRQVLARARTRLGADFVADLERRVVSKESNVRLVRAKVELGAADAAIVYRTDAASSDEVRAIAIPSDLNVEARYPIGLLSDARCAVTARAFIDHTLSEAGQRALAHHGFLAADQ